MGSTRLPGKVMKTLVDKSVLEHVIERVKQAELIDEIIIATTELERDSILVEEAKRIGVKIYRGDEKDVLSRYYGAATEYNIDSIVRITSDCPLIDPKVLDEIVGFFYSGHYDIVSNAGKDSSTRTFPRGLDTEVFSYAALQNAHLKANVTYQREHVTPYIYENSQSINYYRQEKNYSDYRWTLDTEDDFKAISKIYDYLYKGSHDFYLEEIIELYKEHPELRDINNHIEQKKY